MCKRVSSRSRAIAIFLIASLDTRQSVIAKPAVSTQNMLIAFDIPSEPLAAALDAYSSKTGIEVLYDSSLAQTHRSTTLTGEYTAAEALSVLLSRTGLRARQISDGAVTIASMPSEEAATPDPRPAESPYRTYFAAVQMSLERLLCDSGNAIPQNYRSVVKFRIGPTGQIEHPQLLRSNAAPVQDVAVARLFLHMNVGQAPPPSLPQPMMLLILPQSSRNTLNCLSQ
jgi:Secretin and TonB N terminus short domain